MNFEPRVERSREPIKCRSSVGPTLCPDWFPHIIVSGGQTGADRAALDWARGHGIKHGGWCPRGRLASDGPLPLHYQLRETGSTGYRQRTRLNVQDSDATLILNTGELDGGTLQTVRFAVRLGKPHRVFQLDTQSLEVVVEQIADWLKQGKFATVNVAGPREGKRPGIYALVMAVLDCGDARWNGRGDGE